MQSRKKKALGAKYSTADLVLLTMALGGVGYLWWLLHVSSGGWTIANRFPGAARTLGGSPGGSRTAKHK